MNPKKIRLSVPYRDRHQAKALGAHWDPSGVTWYITTDMEAALFQRWIKSPRVTRLRIKAPYLLTRSVTCSRCHALATVYAIGAKTFREGQKQEGHVGCFTLFNIRALPQDFYQALQRRYPTYFMIGPGDDTRLSNHCLCGAAMEDRHLHRLGPHGFRPERKSQLEAIQCQILRLPTGGTWHTQWRSNPLLLSLMLPTVSSIKTGKALCDAPQKNKDPSTLHNTKKEKEQKKQ